MEKFTLIDMIFGAIKQRTIKYVRNKNGIADIDLIEKDIFIGSYPDKYTDVLPCITKMHVYEIVEEGKPLELNELNALVSVVNNKKPIVVLCHRGRGRSAMVILGYLMRYRKLSLNEAIRAIKYIRPIYLNNKQYKRMKEYEQWINYQYV